MEFTILGIKQLQRDLDARLRKVDPNFYCILEKFGADIEDLDADSQSYHITFRAGTQVSATEVEQASYTLFFDNLSIKGYEELLTLLFVKTLIITGFTFFKPE